VSTKLTFDRLVEAIEEIHCQLSRQAKAAVNMSLTLRNWLIGAYLVEYEQGGTDRAEYGAQLVERVAERLGALTRTSARELRRFRSLYLTYPQIGEALTPELRRRLASPLQAIRVAPTPESQTLDDPNKRRFYESPFTRHFYVYEPPRPLVVIEKEIRELEAEIQGMLGEVLG
jgi:hypothetical protein